MAKQDSMERTGPLKDLRVIEMGQLLAGPFCGQLLADFGAEVIKIEPPGVGDPMREWGRERPYGKSLWWPVVARNKKSVTLNLREAEGQGIARKLIATADILIENFRPGTLERWNMSYEALSAAQSAPHHGARDRLRPDRSVFAACRVRLDRRGNGRPAPCGGRSGLAAEPHGDLDRR